MNLSELARRLSTTTQELREKLPALGFDIGARAIKVDDHVAQQITEKWSEVKRKERVQEKFAKQLGEPTEEVAAPVAQVAVKMVALPPVVTVRDFAERLNLPLTSVIRELMKSGILATVNDRIDYNTAAIVAEDLGQTAEPEEKKDSAQDMAMLDRLQEVIASEDKENLRPRPPVVVVMGHVDHGKTKILDSIRKTHVMEGEAGGITQHIGAYQVEKKGRKITFIDTPGHEAFTVMRSRGAKVADIAILVVAADDGVQPQTKEAINIIQAAKLPFVVALNKIDKAEANLDRVKTQLAELGLNPEDWGGKTIMVPVSARAGTNIDQLLEMVLLVADLEKEKIMANPARLAIGTVIESHVDKGAGPVATVLVQSGTLKTGDLLGVRGIFYGRVKIMKDWKGEIIKEGNPGQPVVVLGFKVAPAVGDIAEVSALQATLEQKRMRVASEAPTRVVKAKEEEAHKVTLNIVLKTDVLGSLEAILGMFEKLEHIEVGVKVIGKGLGSVTDADVSQAAAGNGMVFGFNVPVTTMAENVGREKNVEIKRYTIIYDLYDEIRARLETLLPKETFITELGKLEVRGVFRRESGMTIAGGIVTEGKLSAGAKLRIARGEEYIGEGSIMEVQSGKQTAKEVRGGQECGIKIQSKIKLEIGDRLEAYIEETRIRSLVLEGENNKK